MAAALFDTLRSQIAAMEPSRATGRISAIRAGVAVVSGLGSDLRLGDGVVIRHSGDPLHGEVIGLSASGATILPDRILTGVRIGDLVEPGQAFGIAPDDSWIGRIIDADGQPLDGRPLRRGPVRRPVVVNPPPAASRRRLGQRLETGLPVFNTLLPIVRGQRIGLFAGSGVGKSTLLAALAKGIDSDIAVIALIGERGREVREFIEETLGPEGLARSIVVAATSDQSALMRRRTAWTAMTIAEHFRDQGRQVTFLADSVTRFAEAHREVAVAAGEAASLRGYPPSLAPAIMGLAERAGPGADRPGVAGDITAVFSVLVAGSDMDEPVADILRGTLDGHVVLDRTIAERGRYPAIDLLQSVSRSLPGAASAGENALIAGARRLLGAYARSETMILAGLYAKGSDPLTDAAIRCWSDLDGFLGQSASAGSVSDFARLGEILAMSDAAAGQA